MINTALSSPGPNSRFLGRSTMEHVDGILLEHVYGILLDEKFLYRSVHAAFVNTQWYEAWLERTLLLDLIIFDTWGPGVLSWAPGEPCKSHQSRHKTHRHLLFSVCVLTRSSMTSRSVAAAAASSLSRFSCSPSCRGESLVGVRFSHMFGCLACHLSVSFCCVPPLLEFRPVLSTTIARVSLLLSTTIALSFNAQRVTHRTRTQFLHT